DDEDDAPRCRALGGRAADVGGKVEERHVEGRRLAGARRQVEERRPAPIEKDLRCEPRLPGGWAGAMDGPEVGAGDRGREGTQNPSSGETGRGGSTCQLRGGSGR